MRLDRNWDGVCWAKIWGWCSWGQGMSKRVPESWKMWLSWWADGAAGWVTPVRARDTQPLRLSSTRCGRGMLAIRPRFRGTKVLSIWHRLEHAASPVPACDPQAFPWVPKSLETHVANSWVVVHVGEKACKWASLNPYSMGSSN